MQHFDYGEVIDQILEKDNRYHRDAYYFIREGLDYTQHKLAKEAGGKESRHVSGQELVNGVRQYAIDNYGPMAKALLNEWGINSTEDFGEIVFNLVENNLLAKTEDDSREDFSDGFDFEEVFVVPYQPQIDPDKNNQAKTNPDQKDNS